MRNKKISFIVPAYNESGNIEALYEAINSQMGELSYPWELIYVDDGSTDDTLDRVKTIAQKHNNVFYIEFSRNFGHQAALRAGMRYATGDAMITLDADLQHPVRFVPRMIEKWEEGYQVVYTIRREDKRLGWFKRKSSNVFYGLIRSMSEVQLETGAADFRLLDSSVVEVLNTLSECDPFLRGLIKWIGFSQCALEYEPDERFSGQSKYNLKRMVNLAFRGITSFSERPLRLALWLGAIMAVGSVLYLPYVIWTISTGHAMAGWASLLLTVVFLGGLQLLILGIIGLYIGKIFVQSKRRPEFIVKSTSL